MEKNTSLRKDTAIVLLKAIFENPFNNEYPFTKGLSRFVISQTIVVFFMLGSIASIAWGFGECPAYGSITTRLLVIIAMLLSITYFVYNLLCQMYSKILRNILNEMKPDNK